MRHRKSFNHLSRKAGHRKAMLANMAASLILHKRIETTTAKARALRVYVEPLITKSKDDSTHSRRVVFSYLQNKDAVNELFREVSTKVANRPGGYTRILKTGFRLGDNADMCIIELVDYNENLLAAAEETKGKAGTGKRRRRRGSGKIASGETEQVKASEKERVEETKSVEEKPSEETSDVEAAIAQEEVVSDAEIIEEDTDKEKPEASETKAEQSASEEAEKKEETDEKKEDEGK